MLRGLFPRHLRAANASIFAHAPIRPQTAPVQAGKGKKSVKKIVQNCALSCKRSIIKNPAEAGLISLKMFRLFSFDMQT
ncbi:hypothetical protein EK51_001479 [Salmonella enterica subsp. enterica]|nr:hypothetical protein [Salmonella enterica subsp. enterica]